MWDFLTLVIHSVKSFRVEGKFVNPQRLVHFPTLRKRLCRMPIIFVWSSRICRYAKKRVETPREPENFPPLQDRPKVSLLIPVIDAWFARNHHEFLMQFSCRPGSSRFDDNWKTIGFSPKFSLVSFSGEILGKTSSWRAIGKSTRKLFNWIFKRTRDLSGVCLCLSCTCRSVDSNI